MVIRGTITNPGKPGSKHFKSRGAPKMKIVRIGLCLVLLLTSATAQSRVRELPSPAGPGSGQPNLTVSPDGRVYLSWIERLGEGRYSLLLAIKERGLKMPKDIGLVGFNNEPVTSLVTPGISSVDQPGFELGKTAAKLFIERMHNENMDDVEIILKPRLVVRESSLRNNKRTTK